MMRICLSISKKDKEFEKMIQTLSAYGQVDVVGIEGFSLKGYHIFIGKKLSKTALKTADCLQVAFAYKTGVDAFPLLELQKKGVVLVNSHADADIVAEYAFGLSISLVNRITECDRKLRKGIWYDNENPYWKSIFEMKVGLLGYGHIGRHIARILHTNNISTYTLDRGKNYENVTPVQTIKELFDVSDLIILSLPKIPATDDLINEETISQLRGKYIVNVGRSNCVNQEILYNALKDGIIAGAAIDTWDKKPKNKYVLQHPSKYPFGELDNIILSPHQAMRVDKGHGRYVEDITQKVINYITTGVVTDVVDLVKGY